MFAHETDRFGGVGIIHCQNVGCRKDQLSSSKPLDAIQLPATRMAMRIQGVLSETTKAEASHDNHGEHQGAGTMVFRTAFLT